MVMNASYERLKLKEKKNRLTLKLSSSISPQQQISKKQIPFIWKKIRHKKNLKVKTVNSLLPLYEASNTKGEISKEHH